MTRGEYKVGITFNPSGVADVDKIKRMSADLIDAIGNLRQELNFQPTQQGFEVNQLKERAIAKVEDACRTAVAAATKPKWEE